MKKEQQLGWEHEYQNPSLLTKDSKPQKSVLRFFKWLKKEQGFLLENKRVLDLGCGTGRNSNYVAEKGCSVIGYDFSKTAIDLARETGAGLDVSYEVRSIGEAYPVEDDSIDLVLDVTSSNSLSEAERKVYVEEVRRVLRPAGYFFVRALCKDGDSNAKFLLKSNPGKETDTYILPNVAITERVFSKEDFIQYYGAYFKIHFLEKTTHYARVEGQSYKRNYWIAYMQKR